MHFYVYIFTSCLYSMIWRIVYAPACSLTLGSVIALIIIICRPIFLFFRSTLIISVKGSRVHILSQCVSWQLRLLFFLSVRFSVPPVCHVQDGARLVVWFHVVKQRQEMESWSRLQGHELLLKTGVNRHTGFTSLLLIRAF